MQKSASPKPVLFVLIHCLVWWVMTVNAKPVLDGYGDMAEVYAWSQHWLAGSDKHPQFLPWMAKLWFLLAPRSVESFYALSAVNLAVALLGIMALGRALKLGDLRIVVALALAALALPYLTLPGKLNMNAICLSTWPWTAWAFVRATERNATRRGLHAAAFGLLAGVSMLGKYYSVVMLIPLFAYTLLPGQRWLWRGRAPWIATAAFLLATAPHLVWVLQHREAIAYAAEQGAGDETGRRFLYIAKFAVAPLIYWPLSLIVAAVLLARGNAAARIGGLLHVPQGSGVLVAAALGPWLTTMLFSVFGFAELSMPWAIPIGFAFTLYLVANADAAALAANGPRLIHAFRFIWPAMIVAGIAAGALGGLKGDPKFYRPDAESAQSIVENWRASHETPLRWVAKGNDAALVAFLAPQPVEALPALPDRLPAYYPPRPDWKNEAGVIYCSLETQGTADRACLDEAAAWAAANGLNAQEAVHTVRRTGLRFPKDVPFDIAVVYVWPGA